MFKILDGRSHFYQWDLDRKLIVLDKTINKVYFCNRMSSCSIVRTVYEVNGMRLVDVPNIVLQESFKMNVYGFDKNYTKHSAVFEIIFRTRPEDYVYTEEELKVWDELEERVAALEEGGSGKEEVFYFNATISEDLSTFSTQTTFEEINREYKSGKEVICKALYMNGEIQFNIISVMLDSLFVFGANMLNVSMSVSITADNEISITNDTIMLLSNLETGLQHYEVITNQGLKDRLVYYPTKEEMEAAIEAIPQPEMSGYYTKTEIDNKGYLTAHQDLSAYALKTDIPNTSSFITMAQVEGKGYQTEAQVNDLINTALGVIENGTY